MRHLLIPDKKFSYRSAEHFEEFQLYEQHNLNHIRKDPTKNEIYVNILS